MPGQDAFIILNNIRESKKVWSNSGAVIEDLGDDELEQKTIEFKHRVQQKGESINGPLLEEAFAVVREAAWYVNYDHYSLRLQYESNNA